MYFKTLAHRVGDLRNRPKCPQSVQSPSLSRLSGIYGYARGEPGEILAMSLGDRIIDAEVLWRQGRTEGAVLSILLAVQVPARERYPEGTKSKTRVNKKTGKRRKMGDGEAFRTFLKEELRRPLRENQRRHRDRWSQFGRRQWQRLRIRLPV